MKHKNKPSFPEKLFITLENEGTSDEFFEAYKKAENIDSSYDDAEDDVPPPTFVAIYKLVSVKELKTTTTLI